MLTRMLKSLVFLAAIGSSVILSAASGAEKLSSYSIDRNFISISGISSGGYMAQQFHVAHSQEIMGAGILAGGPYDCANSEQFMPPVLTALTVCSHFTSYMPFGEPIDPGKYMSSGKPIDPGKYNFPEIRLFGGPPDPDKSISATNAAARAHTIDNPDGMRDDKVWLFHGTQDELVPEPVMDALETYYKHYVNRDNITYIKNVDAAHAWVTEEFGSPCNTLRSPYINDCDYDAAGKLLQHIYGPLSPKGTAASGTMIEFDQTPFFNASDSSISMNRLGHLYVPNDCTASNANCKLHIALHGCEQSQETIGDAFYTHAGLNEWAATNKIVVLYPQATSSSENPKSCWNWWGYGSDNAFYNKSGKQIAAIQKMIDHLARP